MVIGNDVLWFAVHLIFGTKKANTNTSAMNYFRIKIRLHTNEQEPQSYIRTPFLKQTFPGWQTIFKASFGLERK